MLTNVLLLVRVSWNRYHCLVSIYIHIRIHAHHSKVQGFPNLLADVAHFLAKYSRGASSALCLADTNINRLMFLSLLPLSISVVPKILQRRGVDIFLKIKKSL